MVKMLLLLVTLAVFGGTTGALRPDELPSKRLIDATEIDIKFAPFTMQIRVKGGTFFCGGSLISPRFVVTAAHCVSYYSNDDLVVIGNASTISEVGIQRNIVKIIMHPKFNSNTIEYDIAVLKLDRDMTGTNVKTIPMYEKSLEQGNSLQVYGWGYTEKKELSEHLRTIRVPVISQNECAKIYRKERDTITDVMVCAFEPGKDACRCDSGGPAVYKGQLAGVVSWGKECAVYPGVYTRIDKTRDFIDDCLKK